METTLAAPHSATPNPVTAAQEWRANWGLLLSAIIGVSFGSIPASSLGLFMEPLESDFGWSRTMISGGLMVFAFVGLFIGPLAGALLDRIGARRCVIPGLVGAGLSFASFSLMTGLPWQWWAAWLGYSLSYLLVRSVVWNSAISHAFVVSRGLAISFVLSGFGFARIVGPWFAHTLIEEFGWRNAYLILGLGWPGLGLLLALVLFQTRIGNSKPAATGSKSTSGPLPTGGLTLGEALRDPAMLRIAFSTVVTFGVLTSATIHIVPILGSAGIDVGVAAGLAGLIGIGSLAGNFGAGWLADRTGSGYVPAAMFGLPAIGYLLVWQGSASPAMLGAGVFFLGFGLGTSLQMATYLTTRYAGLRHFGKIFGLITSAVGFATGLGPMLTGWIYDVTGSYSLFFMVAIPAALVAGLGVIGLGPYRDFAAAEAAARSDR